MSATRQVYTFANREAWPEFIHAMRSGDVVEVDEEIYDWFLGVLPPAAYGALPLNDGGTVEAEFGFAEGWELIVAFWHRDGRAYCQQTARLARG
jgi:hypothetical protein